MMKYSALLCIVVLASSLSGQDVNKNLPRDFSVPSESELTIPEISDELSEDSNRVLIRRLKGLRFVDSVAAVPVADESGSVIEIDSGLLIAGDAWLIAQLETFLNAELTFADISEIRRIVYGVYRERGFPVVDIAIPEQEITAGSLRLSVTESRLGTVRVEGGRHLNRKAKLRQIRQTSGERIDTFALQRSIDWLNRDPFAEADLVLEPGDAFGESDVSLVLSDAFPAYGYFGYEDTGNEATGLGRYFVGGSWGNLFNLDHEIAYQYMSAADTGRINIHALDYTIRLPWHDELVFSGIYSDYKAAVSVDSLSLSEDGVSFYAGARYRTALPDLFGVEQAATLGFDFKQSNSNVEFGGLDVFDGKFDILQWLLRYDAGAVDAWGVTDFSATLVYSPGNLTGKNEDGIVSAEADYIYGFLELKRTTYLPKGFLLNTGVRAQTSDNRLFASEQFGLGGFDTVRGYDYREVNGDEGYLVNTELRSPIIESRQLLPGLPFSMEARVLAFWEFGHSRIIDPEFGEIPETYVASSGLGSRLSITEHFRASVDYGWQLKEIESDAGDGRFHINLTAVF